jgi:hypothetical protein
MGVYLLYLIPYIAASYYERYALPLLGVKVLLVIWGAEKVASWLPRRTRPQPVARKADPCQDRPAGVEAELLLR